MKRNIKKQKICVIGMGFVGAVSAIVFSNISKNNKSKYNVIGIEKNDLEGKEKAKKLNDGIFISKTEDKNINTYLKKSKKYRNFEVKLNFDDLRDADYVIIAINLDLKGSINSPNIDFSNLIKVSQIIGSKIKKSACIVVETTVPPGTCDKIIMPTIKKKFKLRGINSNPNLIHSYERVTPGADYIKSIKSTSRIYSSSSNEAKNKFIKLYKDVIDLKNFSLVELDKFLDSESAKILENSYRAINIAFLQEWTEFSLMNKLSINKILDAIKLRKTHNNIMRPGLGVGGYCLTKDPIFAYFSNKNFFKDRKNQFIISKSSMKINKQMPNFTFNIIKKILKNIKKPKIAIYGITYKEGIGDLRFSPSLYLVKKLLKVGFDVDIYDPLVKKLPKSVNSKLNLNFDYNKYNLILFTVKNKLIEKFKFNKIFYRKNFYIIDTDKCLSENITKTLLKKKINFINFNA